MFHQRAAMFLQSGSQKIDTVIRTRCQARQRGEDQTTEFCRNCMRAKFPVEQDPGQSTSFVHFLQWSVAVPVTRRNLIGRSEPLIISVHFAGFFCGLWRRCRHGHCQTQQLPGKMPECPAAAGAC